MKILIGDDHRLFRDGLRLQLQQFDPTLEIFDASSFPEVFDRLRDQCAIDLVLVDLGMPGGTWDEALNLLATDHSNLPVVVISATDDRVTILRALELGIAGFIPKTSSGDVMLSALRLVLSGGVYLPPEVLRHVTNGDFSAGSGIMDTGKGGEPPSLSPRQTEVLHLMADGRSNKEIATLLDLSEGTVKSHVAAILRALNVRNRAQAIIAATRFNMVKID